MSWPISLSDGQWFNLHRRIDAQMMTRRMSNAPPPTHAVMMVSFVVQDELELVEVVTFAWIRMMIGALDVTVTVSV